MWFSFCEFVEGWIWPAYNLRNFLFHRYDLVKCKGVGRSEYSDVTYRMFAANMELIRTFVEDEHPEDHVLWYTDEFGNDVGHHLYEGKVRKYVEEYDGKYIMDVVKEIYKWWKFILPVQEKEANYLLKLWSQLKKIQEPSPIDEFLNSQAKSLAEIEKNMDWDIAEKYSDGDPKNMLNYKFVGKKYDRLMTKIFDDTQKYLHLTIDVRPYLWT